MVMLLILSAEKITFIAENCHMAQKLIISEPVTFIVRFITSNFV